MTRQPNIVDAILRCPRCGKVHLDLGEWATRPHTSHLCCDTPEGPGTGCGHEWAVADFTVRGVAPRQGLFATGDFVLSSKQAVARKIECDALSDAEVDTIADMAAQVLAMSEIEFSEVIPIPRGGDRFAASLRRHATAGAERVVVADDVMTTGGSFRRKIAELVAGGRDIKSIIGCAMFRRMEAASLLWDRSARYTLLYVPEDATRLDNATLVYHPIVVWA